MDMDVQGLQVWRQELWTTLALPTGLTPDLIPLPERVPLTMRAGVEVAHDWARQWMAGRPIQDHARSLVEASFAFAWGAQEPAHEAIQDLAGETAAYLHAQIHRVEGDLWNCDYWARRCAGFAIRRHMARRLPALLGPAAAAVVEHQDWSLRLWGESEQQKIWTPEIARELRLLDWLLLLRHLRDEEWQPERHCGCGVR